jgi:hypothetical protein
MAEECVSHIPTPSDLRIWLQWTSGSYIVACCVVFAVLVFACLPARVVFKMAQALFSFVEMRGKDQLVVFDRVHPLVARDDDIALLRAVHAQRNCCVRGCRVVYLQSPLVMSLQGRLRFMVAIFASVAVLAFSYLALIQNNTYSGTGCPPLPPSASSLSCTLAGLDSLWKGVRFVNCSCTASQPRLLGCVMPQIRSLASTISNLAIVASLVRVVCAGTSFFARQCHSCVLAAISRGLPLCLHTAFRCACACA